MQTEIRPSKAFNYKIWGIPVCLILFVVSVSLVISPDLKDKSVESLLCDCFLSATMLYLVFYLILQLIFIPNGAIINYDTKEICLKYTIAKPKTIRISDISTFEKICIKTKNGPYHGLVVYLPDGKRVLLSDFNLNGYLPVKDFLDDQNVGSIGDGSFSFTKYFMHQ